MPLSIIMLMKLEITGKGLVGLALFAVAFAFVAAVVAQPGIVASFAPPATIPNPGHSSVDVIVNVSGTPPCSGDISLQSAIDNSCIGGPGGGTSLWADQGTYINPVNYSQLAITDAGRVGIGTTSPQSVLDIASTTSGFLPPRMTTAQRNSIAGPPSGSIIYNNSLNTPEFYNGSQWIGLGKVVIPPSYWSRQLWFNWGATAGKTAYPSTAQDSVGTGCYTLSIPDIKSFFHETRNIKALLFNVTVFGEWTTNSLSSGNYRFFVNSVPSQCGGTGGSSALGGRNMTEVYSGEPHPDFSTDFIVYPQNGQVDLGIFMRLDSQSDNRNEGVGTNFVLYGYVVE